MINYKNITRVKYFDISKGVAILAIVIGHCALGINEVTPQIIAQVVYRICFSFHR